MTRAVAPVIATLLLVAIAVVGGSLIFVFSQGFFESIQVEENTIPLNPCDDYKMGFYKTNCLQNQEIIKNQERIIELLESQN